MKLRQIALSIAAASAIGAAAPSFAQSDIGTYPPAPPPESLSPFNSQNTDSSTTDSSTIVVVPPPSRDAITSPGYTYNPNDGTVNGAIVTEQGGMTPQERRDTAGTADRATGQVTAPGYMGPHDSKGQ
jgi:hypothetical protein